VAIVIKATKARDLMPAVSHVRASQVLDVEGIRRPPTIRDFIDDIRKRRLETVEYQKEIAELLGGGGEAPRTAVVVKEEKKEDRTKHYNVDPKTGEISVDEEEGEYTRRDAQLVSLSIAARRGEYDRVMEVINAMKGGKPADSDSRPREYVVDDIGQVDRDPENGEYTLVEAREIARSRRAANTPQVETVDKKDLELLKGSIKEDLKATVIEEVGKVQLRTTGSTPKETEPPFTLNEKGEVQVRKGAMLTVAEAMLYTNMMNRDKEGRLFKDKDGMVMDLPSWLTVSKHEREEDRKDAVNNEVVDLFKLGKQELPSLLASLKNLTTSKHAKEALDKGGWGKKGSAEITGVQQTTCAGCGEKLYFSQTPAILSCTKCPSITFIGSPGHEKEQFDDIKAQMAAEPKLVRAEGAGADKTKEGALLKGAEG
jgi:hypothetical protein